MPLSSIAADFSANDVKRYRINAMGVASIETQALDLERERFACKTCGMPAEFRMIGRGHNGKSLGNMCCLKCWDDQFEMTNLMSIRADLLELILPDKG